MAFSRKQHAAILLGECTVDCAFGNKLLMQSNSDGCITAQSQTSCYSQYLGTYQAPIIVCANSWLSKKQEKEEPYTWLVESSVRIDAEKPCFENPSQAS